MGNDNYDQVSFDLNAELKEAMHRPGFKETYDALEEESLPLPLSLRLAR
jgi:hypothetical protein